MGHKLVAVPKKPAAELRPLIREALCAHKAKLGLSIQQIAVEIENLRPKLYAKGDRPSPISKHSVQRILTPPGEKEGPVGRSYLDIFYRYAVEVGALAKPDHGQDREEDSIYGAISAFFSVNRAAAEVAARELAGDYEFYVKSESHSGVKPYIVRGAMRFAEDPETGAALIHERRSTPSFSGPDEDWHGYFFVSKRTLVLILRNDQATDANERPPKFYVLSLPEIRNPDGTIFEMKGRMMKVGVPGGIFTSRAVFRRNKDAFQKADIVDADTVKEVIRNAVLLPSGDQ